MTTKPFNSAEIIKLKESELKYRTIFEDSKVGLVLCEMDGSLVECNQAFLDIVEYSKKEALKLSYWDVTPIEYKADEVQQLLSLEQTGRYGPYEKHFITKSGKRRPVLLNGSLLKENDGKDRIWNIVQDISDRKYIEEKLKLALESEEIANRSKSEFLSSMSHELRTPMNAIIGFGQLLQFDSKDPLTLQQRGHVEHILKGGKRLLELVEHVLDLSKIESGNIKFSVQKIQINTLCLKTLDAVRAEAKERDLSIKTDISDKAIFIKADVARFQKSLHKRQSNFHQSGCCQVPKILASPAVECG
ncbi:MAG: PAS domain S-box protein [Magnetovibrio sp.]|nr:PAS domain S-box protein [Magnetovibrio sp.]